MPNFILHPPSNFELQLQQVLSSVKVHETSGAFMLGVRAWVYHTTLPHMQIPWISQSFKAWEFTSPSSVRSRQSEPTKIATSTPSIGSQARLSRVWTMNLNWVHVQFHLGNLPLKNNRSCNLGRCVSRKIGGCYIESCSCELD